MAKNKRLIIAKKLGTCFGVERALKLAADAAEKGCRKAILGDIVHNSRAVAEITKKGIEKIKSYKCLKQGDCLIIRAHGELREVFSYCKKNNIEVIDARCPIVKECLNKALYFQSKGYFVIIIGKKEHPEIRAIAGNLSDYAVVSSIGELNNTAVESLKKIAIISQTTFRHSAFIGIVREIISRAKQCRSFSIENTICNATIERQKAAKELAEKAETVFVVGGNKSLNTRKLYEICSQLTKAYMINSKDEIKEEMLEGKETIGITAGASTPSFVIKEVIEFLESRGFKADKDSKADKQNSEH